MIGGSYGRGSGILRIAYKIDRETLWLQGKEQQKAKVETQYVSVILGSKRVLGKSKLDGREDEVKRLLALGISKASIAKITGGDRSTLYNFIRSRGLAPNP